MRGCLRSIQRSRRAGMPTMRPIAKPLRPATCCGRARGEDGRKGHSARPAEGHEPDVFHRRREHVHEPHAECKAREPDRSTTSVPKATTGSLNHEPRMETTTKTMTKPRAELGGLPGFSSSSVSGGIGGRHRSSGRHSSVHRCPVEALDHGRGSRNGAVPRLVEGLDERNPIGIIGEEEDRRGAEGELTHGTSLRRRRWCRSTGAASGRSEGRDPRYPCPDRGRARPSACRRG